MVVRIAVVRHLLWNRYGDFWVKLFEELDVEVVTAQHSDILKALKDKRLEEISSLSFQFAAAEALALVDADALLVPDLNATSNSRKVSGEDPWIANFPETLATRMVGLLPIIAVPSELNDDLESLVIETLMSISRDPARVRLAWERHKGKVKHKKRPEPRWQKRASENSSVAIVSQPWLSAKAILNFEEDTHTVYAEDMDFLSLRAEGQRLDENLIATDQEVLGAARLMARKGGIDRLVFLADKGSGADERLYQRITKIVHKPLSRKYVQDLVTNETLLN